MRNKILFKETQQMREPWLWVILIAVSAFIIIFFWFLKLETHYGAQGIKELWPGLSSEKNIVVNTQNIFEVDRVLRRFIENRYINGLEDE